jgi:CyaY protein
MPNMITESEFIAAADRALSAIGDALDAALDESALDLDWSLNDGILELECGDGSKIIVNRHVPNRELWVAARSGGFHFRPREGRWVDTRVGWRARRGARCAAARAGGIESRSAAAHGPRCLGPLACESARLEQRGPVVERLARDGRAGEQALDHVPEARRMIELDQVRDLVRDDVKRKLGRQLDQSSS